MGTGEDTTSAGDAGEPAGFDADAGAGETSASADSAGGGEAGAAGRTVDTDAGAAPDVRRMESVGLVADASATGLAAEAAAALPGDTGGAVTAVDSSGSWAQLTPHLTTITCAVVLPQWKISTEEQHEVSGALGQCMEQLFPGGIDGKYACWVRLIAACGAITISRAQQPGGLPPLFMNKRRPKPEPPPAPAPTGAETLTSLTPGM